MTRVFLAAGVAALAIAAPGSAAPHGDKGGHAVHSKEERSAQRAQRAQKAERASSAKAERAQRVAAERPERPERVQVRAERKQVRSDRQEARSERASRVQTRAAERKADRVERAQSRISDRKQARSERVQRVDRADRPDRMDRGGRMDRVENRAVERRQARVDRIERAEDRALERGERRAGRIDARLASRALGYGVGACPPGLADKAVACVPPGQAKKMARLDARAFQSSRIQALTARTRMLAPTQVIQYVGQPVRSLSNVVTLAALPRSVSYLYPDNDDYYYRYGDGYLYRVERKNDLIDWILPLLAGGLLPGQYLPSSYMNSYAPNYYGLNSFYPANGYSYGYGQVCNRYGEGVIYQVDCSTGMIQNVVPMYAAGYGVGQMIPSSYAYYNLPTQYRSLYYDTNDYNYWYAPGAIYQYDPTSSLITSVAALLAPGFSIGQQLPMGYNAYNVPYGYRSTYYDTPNAWYRYNNGYIYQVDPTTQLVTAIVASILT